MKIEKLERLEHVEDILQEKIAHAETELRSLGEMKDAEIYILRSMYLMNLQQMRCMLISLRRKLDREYTRRRIEELGKRIEKNFPDTIWEGWVKDDEAGDTGEMPGNGAGAETHEQPGMSERSAGGWTGGGIRHVQPDGAEHQGDDAGEPLRPRRRWQRWQIETIVESMAQEGRTKANAGTPSGRGYPGVRWARPGSGEHGTR